MGSLENLMGQLADSTKRLGASQISGLSDLSLPDARRFEELWLGLGVVRRRQVIRQLVAEAEAKVEVNFDRVFKACLKDPDEVIRATAIEGLWECYETGLVGNLVAILRDDPSQAVRAVAAKALGVFVLLAELGKLRPRYGDLLAEALSGVLEGRNQPLEVRREALQSIAYFSQDRVLEIIEQAYHSGELLMKISAIRAMGRNLDPRWLEILLTELSSPEAELRLEAARACGELADERAVPGLIERLEDEEPQVQVATVQSLGQIGGERAMRVLTRMLNHPRPAVRKAAQEAIQETQLDNDSLSLSL